MMDVWFCGNVFSKTERWRMRQLVARFGKAVKGVLTGFDRILSKPGYQDWPAARPSLAAVVSLYTLTPGPDNCGNYVFCQKAWAAR